MIVITILINVTDGQTDRRTDRRLAVAVPVAYRRVMETVSRRGVASVTMRRAQTANSTLTA